MVAGQVLIIFFGGKALKVVPLDGIQWAICIVLGLISLPVAVIIRMIPDACVERIMPKALLSANLGGVSLPDGINPWASGQDRVHKELNVVHAIRGGRINQLDYRASWARRRHGVKTTTIGRAVAAGAFMSGGIGAPSRSDYPNRIEKRKWWQLKSSEGNAELPK